MLEKVRGPEGRSATSRGVHRVAIVGSREWGDSDAQRRGCNCGHKVHDWAWLESQVMTEVVHRLIARYVIGMNGDWDKRQQDLPPGPGLYVVTGGAPGADSCAEKVVRAYGEGLRRRSRDEFLNYHDGYAVDPLRLADGLWLDVRPADWDRFDKQAGWLRNEEMVHLVDHVIALFAHDKGYHPKGPGGTNDMVRRAITNRKDVWVYEADTRQWKQP